MCALGLGAAAARRLYVDALGWRRRGRRQWAVLSLLSKLPTAASRLMVVYRVRT